MFDKLAHASIMKLNSNSMDKLYDLMTMAVKYQVKNIFMERGTIFFFYFLKIISIIIVFKLLLPHLKYPEK